MGKPIEGKIAANNCPFVPFPGVCLPRLVELNKTHLSCNSHNIPRAPFGARRGERRGRTEQGRMGSRREPRGEDTPAGAGMWRWDREHPAAPSTPWPSTSRACTGTKRGSAHPQHPKTARAACLGSLGGCSAIPPCPEAAQKQFGRSLLMP